MNFAWTLWTYQIAVFGNIQTAPFVRCPGMAFYRVSREPGEWIRISTP